MLKNYIIDYEMKNIPFPVLKHSVAGTLKKILMNQIERNINPVTGRKFLSGYFVNEKILFNKFRG